MYRSLTLLAGVLSLALSAMTVTAAPTDGSHDLSAVPAGAPWRVVQRHATHFEGDGRRGVHFTPHEEVQGGVWLEGVEFADGELEVEIRGRDHAQRNFVGLAFHGLDDRTYDAVYFRPFNFDDPTRAAVQYVSHPDHPWYRLREEHPRRYEQPIANPPAPEAWFHARVVVRYPRVEVYVDGAREPSLVVDKLNARRSGKVGLWVWNEAEAEFANLRITHRPAGTDR